MTRRNSNSTLATAAPKDPPPRPLDFDLLTPTETRTLSDLVAVVNTNRAKRWRPDDVWPSHSPMDTEHKLTFAYMREWGHFDALLAERDLARTTDGLICVADYRVANADGVAKLEEAMAKAPDELVLDAEEQGVLHDVLSACGGTFGVGGHGNKDGWIKVWQLWLGAGGKKKKNAWFRLRGRDDAAAIFAAEGLEYDYAKNEARLVELKPQSEPAPQTAAVRKTKKADDVGLLPPPPVIAAPTAIAARTAERTTLFLDVKSLVSSPWNPRIFHGDDAKNPELVGLGESIKAQGLIQPITVRPYRPWHLVEDQVLTGAWIMLCRDTKKKGGPEKSYVNKAHAEDVRDELNGKEAGRFEIVAGERRWRAAKVAGLSSIEAFVVAMTDADALAIIVTENLQRQDLSVLEESKGVATLLENGWTEAAVADKLGRPASWVARRAQIQRLSPKVQEALDDPKSAVYGLPAALLTILARVDHATQDRFVETHEWSGLQEFTERELKQAINAYLRRVDKTPWDPADATLVALAGACTTCHKRNDRQQLLFDEEDDEAAPEKGARCLDAACYETKAAAHAKRVAAKVAEKNDAPVTMVRDHKDRINVDDYDADREKKEKETPYLYQITECKKTDKGAKPAVIENGPRAGQVLYFSRTTNEKPPLDGRSFRGKQNDNGTASPKSLADRRRELEKRRKLHALKLAAKEIKHSDHVPAAHVVVAFAAVFGTAHRRDHAQYASSNPEFVVEDWIDDDAENRGPVPSLLKDGHRGYRKPKSLFALVRLMAGLNPDREDNDQDGDGVARRVLWSSVVEVLAKWFQCTWTPDDTNVREMVEAGETVVPVAMPKKTFEQFLDQAEEDLPEPKSWTNLNADGTPKGTIVSGKTASAGDDTPERVRPRKKPKKSAAKQTSKATSKKKAKGKAGGRAYAGAGS